MLGGKPGTVRELAFGQKYVTNYGFTPQIDIINLSAWARLKSASVNYDLTEVNNLIAKKNLFESIAASYFNIISLQNQLASLEKNASASDSVLKIITNKYNLGVAREQDKNNAEINSLSVKDKLDELKTSLEQQYNTMKTLCDIQQTSEIKINIEEKVTTSVSSLLNTKSTLEVRQKELQTAYKRSELRANRLITFSPTLSFIFNQAWQQSSNTGFFDANAYHYSTQYYGIKLTVPFPLDVNRLALDYTAKIDYKISQISSEHTALQNNINNKQLELDYAKAYSGYVSSKKISELKGINYEKSMNQYKEGVLSTDLLLTAFTDMINAQLLFINAEAALHYAESKIKINNTYN
jgi:OMF family outer membrane factor